MSRSKRSADSFGCIWHDLKNPLAALGAGLGMVASAVTLLVALYAGPGWLRWATVAAMIMGAALFVCFTRGVLGRIARLLSWRFAAGLAVGLVLGVAATLVVMMLAGGLLRRVPQVDLVESIPLTGAVLKSPWDNVTFRFSNDVPERYQDETRFHITPRIPLTYSWNGDTLVVYGAKRFPLSASNGSSMPRFDYDTPYRLEVTGPFLARPVAISFRTPKS